MEDQLEERIKRSETHSYKTVYPNTTNHHNTLYGGEALSIMDDTAFITATRYSRQRFVTVSTDKVSFMKAIPASTMIEAIGSVHRVGHSSITINVKIYVEQMYCEGRELAIEGLFTMVAVDKDGKSEKIK